jgi:hypothetical protein
MESNKHDIIRTNPKFLKKILGERTSHDRFVILSRTDGTCSSEETNYVFMNGDDFHDSIPIETLRTYSTDKTR